jgi:hypothetical protein
LRDLRIAEAHRQTPWVPEAGANGALAGPFAPPANS